ncbi:uncharacterized protein EI97DRAFT_454328 [Westerdykella ornata]|uniref:Uncharacterized protein n=1 Tax=Westerdykella ornata TaxID=318751 RepID=A0A6A6JWX1_WESOR|nr:uncharacterized protein EI97DRAFT_454328 [Westerdykella ornata]KAF2281110.1 hypothetical protein EI97DRAFT_454328 [Westerdykella ornata]
MTSTSAASPLVQRIIEVTKKRFSKYVSLDEDELEELAEKLAFTIRYKYSSPPPREETIVNRAIEPPPFVCSSCRHTPMASTTMVLVPPHSKSYTKASLS